MPIESDIQKAIIALLTARGYLVIRINGGRSKTGVAFNRWYIQDEPSHTTGVSDIIALSPSGLLVCIECKAPGEKPTEAQKSFLYHAERRGAVCIVADSVDAVTEVLDGN